MMKKQAFVVVLVLAAFTTVGCSSAGDDSSEQSSSVATLTADAALDQLITAFSTLQSVDNSEESLINGFNVMIAGMNPVAEGLLEGISGVPSDVTDDLAVAVGAFASTSQLVVDCLQLASAVSDCEALVSGATSESQELGTAISELVPYSNMTIEELTARLG